MSEGDDPYPCVGVCMIDPDSGYCLGCGRPPLASPVVVVELAASASAATMPAPPSGDPDTPAP
jgi:hypothetical protein